MQDLIRCTVCGFVYHSVIGHECPGPLMTEARVREIVREEIARMQNGHPITGKCSDCGAKAVYHRDDWDGHHELCLTCQTTRRLQADITR